MTYNKINLMIPTYGREKTKLPRMLQSSMDASSAPTTNYVDYTFLVNKNDSATKAFIQNRMSGYCHQIIEEDLLPGSMPEYYNIMYEKTKFKDPGTLVSFLGDDMVFLTKNYDQRILEEVNKRQGMCFVYCTDSYYGHSGSCVNMFTTRKLVEATKKPFMKTGYCGKMPNEAWIQLQNKVNIGVYLPDVVIEHDHESKKPMNLWDETKRRKEATRSTVVSGDMQEYVEEIAKALRESGLTNK